VHCEGANGGGPERGIKDSTVGVGGGRIHSKGSQDGEGVLKPWRRLGGTRQKKLTQGDWGENRTPKSRMKGQDQTPKD